MLALCCLTEKTGLHQCSLEVGHNTDRWRHEGEGREEPRARRNHATGFIRTYSKHDVLLLLPAFSVIPNDLALHLYSRSALCKNSKPIAMSSSREIHLPCILGVLLKRSHIQQSSLHRCFLTMSILWVDSPEIRKVRFSESVC